LFKFFLLFFYWVWGGAGWWGRRGAPPPGAAARGGPRYVLVGQLVLMYCTTGLQKVSIGWVPGGPLDALWYILQQPTWQRGSMRWLAPLYPVTQIATLTTWAFEVGSPLLLLAFWYRATRERPGRLRAWFNRHDFRTKYLALGLFLHLGVELTMEVGPFIGGVLALYTCCFHPGEWQQVGQRLVAMRRRRAASRASA
jgi:hypothetical protein